MTRCSFALALFTVAGCGTSTTIGTDAGTSVDAPALDAGGGGTDSGSGGADTGSDSGTSTTGDGVHCLGVPSGSCAPGEVCCGGSTGITCTASAAECTGTPLACDGPEDCGGSTCCSDIGSSCTSGTCARYRLCHTAGDCASGESCCPNGGGVPQGALSHCTTLAAGTSCPLPP